MSRELLAHPRVQSVSLQVGRAELGEDTASTDFSELIVALKDGEGGEEAGDARAGIRRLLSGVPGARFAVLPFLEERIEETISGTRAEVVVRIYGEDLEAIDRAGEEVAGILQRIRGSADVRFLKTEEPRLVVRLRRERLKQFGFRPLEVLEAVQLASQGVQVAQTFDGNRVFAVVAVLEEESRREPESLRDLLLHGSDGQLVPLGEVADVFLSTGRQAVRHESTRRFEEVTCNVQGRDLQSFVREAKETVFREVSSAPGLFLQFAGAGEAQTRARREILLHSFFAGTGILLLLGTVFRSLRNLLLVLVNLPFALVGGVLAVLFTGGELSLGSLVGFVTLFGITTRNSIMMVSHFEHLVARERCSWGIETALRGASERCVPVLMTGLVTALGLLPIALGAGEPGREIEGPMAMVILGGLASSTALNLLVLPSLALRFGRFGRVDPAEETGEIHTPLIGDSRK